MLKRYVFNILISIDQLVNTLIGGDPDETLSSRMGKLVREWRQKPYNKGRYIISLIICWLLHLIDSNHCNKSIEEDEGKNSIWNK